MVDIYEKIIIGCSGIILGFFLNLFYVYIKFRHNFLLTQKALAIIFLTEISKNIMQLSANGILTTSFFDSNKIELAKYLPQITYSYATLINLHNNNSYPNAITINDLETLKSELNILTTTFSFRKIFQL